VLRPAAQCNVHTITVSIAVDRGVVREPELALVQRWGRALERALENDVIGPWGVVGECHRLAEATLTVTCHHIICGSDRALPGNQRLGCEA
jgi:hypothetical protein